MKSVRYAARYGRRARRQVRSDGGWSPRRIGDELALWLRAHVGIARVGQTVSTAADSSAQGNDLAPSGAAAPLLIGHGFNANRPALDCIAGSTQGLRENGPLGALVAGTAQPFTVVMRVAFSAVSGGETLIAWGGSGANTPFIRLNRNAGGSLGFSYKNDAGTISSRDSSQTPLAAAGTYTIVFRSTGTTISARVDGAALTYSSAGDITGIGAFTTAFFALAHLWRGGADVANYATARFGEVLVAGRALTDEEILDAEAYIENTYADTTTFGAGDVLIYCGQSNCAGRVTVSPGVAPPAATPNPNGDILYSTSGDYDSGGWVQLQAPIDDNGTYQDRYGPAMHLGEELRALRGEGFSIVQRGVAATSADAWNNTQFALLKAHVDRALEGSGTSDVRWVVYHQGEAEAGAGGAAASGYEAELTELIDRFQAEWPGARVVIVRLADTQSVYGSLATIRAAQAAVAAAQGCLLVDIDGAPVFDTEHFSAAGVEQIGGAIAATIDWEPATPGDLVLYADFAVGVTDVGGDASAVADQSGAGNHGTTTGAGVRPLIEATGWNGERPSLLFTASTADCIEFNGAAAQFSGAAHPYTIHRLVQRTGAETGERYECGFGRASSVFPAIRLGQVAGSNARLLHQRDNAGLESSSTGAASSNLVVTRHQITATFDGTTRRLYVDGVEVDTDTAVLGDATFDRFYFGTWRTASSYDFRSPGFMVYSRALVASELAYLWGFSREHFGGLPP